MNITPLLFQKLVLHWFDHHGRKQLPWQMNKEPYRVWISEIMLQQTQVNTVIPYFEKFMQQFPCLSDLANANEDQVLHAWSGLGYYSRARNVHKAALKIMHECKGRFPATLANLISLPGIGRSTAGAVLSIAYDRPAAILDGNVKRVLARFLGIDQPINEKSTEDKLWEYAEKFVSAKRPADYTQAMMDLGAILCTRTSPTCSACPLVKHCTAFSQGTVNQLPVKKPSRRLPKRSATFILLQQKDGSLLLQKRPSLGIWGGLWSFPEIPGKPDKQTIQRYCHQYCHLTVRKYQPLKPLQHTFSHFQLEIFPVLIRVNKEDTTIRKQCKTNKPPIKIREIDEDEHPQIWYHPLKPAHMGLPKPVHVLIKQASQNK